MRTRETRKRHLQVELLEGRFALSGGAVLTQADPPQVEHLAGGAVLPRNATPQGYSLTDMARETALFLTSGNNQDYYPDTPFQVLYFDPSTRQVTPTPDGGVEITGSNSFTVSPRTFFYANLLNADDSDTIVGNFPTDVSGAAGYFFAQNQLGVRNTEIIVDGKSTPVRAAYVAGPVKTPPLLDGPPAGTHMIELAVFLSPMSPGTHTVEVKGEFAGKAFQAATGLTFARGDFIYTVHVVA